MADLPVIPEDINAPLPEVPADSPLVPYRIGSLDTETGARKVTTGWGKRGVRPEQDPMSQIALAAQQAFATMPTEDAERAVAAAIRFQGLRGYQQDIKNGVAYDQAIAKWGPSLFYQNPSAMGSAMRAVQRPEPIQEVPANLKTGMPAYILSGNRPYFAPTQRTGSNFTPAAVQEVNSIAELEDQANALAAAGDEVGAAKVAGKAKMLRMRTNLSKITPAQSAKKDMLQMKIRSAEKQIENAISADQIKAASDLASKAYQDYQSLLEELEANSQSTPPSGSKTLDKATAEQFLKQAGGNKAKARQLARQAGYTF